MTAKIESHNPENKRMVARMISLIHDANNNIPAYLNNLVVDRLLWAMTEHDNDGKRKKHIGQPFWSAEALKKYLNNRDQLKPFYGLIHEHAVPKKVIKKLIKSSINNESDIFKILNTFGHAVIITNDEDQLLKKNGFETRMSKELENNSTIDNVFSRYIEVGIKVCDVRGKELRNITSDDIDELEKGALTIRSNPPSSSTSTLPPK